MKGQPTEAKYRHPEQRAGAYIDWLDLHLLAVQPQLRRRRRRDLHRGSAVVNCDLCVQRKEEHQGAERQQ